MELWTSNSNGVTIQGNNIGVGADRTSQIVPVNSEDLVYIGGGSSHSNLLIGGSAPGQGNLIAFSSRSGIRLESSGSNIQVIGNTIRNNARAGLYLTNNTRAALVGNSNAPSAPQSLAQCTYTPVPGYEPQVRYVCLNPKGSLPAGGVQGQVQVRLRLRIN